MKKYLICFYFLALFFLFSCAAKQPAVDNSIPDWYLQPAQYVSSNLLYGAGSGDYLEEARKRALKNMSYNFQLQVQASSVNQTSSNRSANNTVTTTSSLQEEIKLDSKQLTFTKVQDHKVEQVGTKYYVVLTTDYADLIAENRNKLEKNLPDLKIVIESLGQKSALGAISLLATNEQKYIHSLDAQENLEILNLAYKNSSLTTTYLTKNRQVLQEYNQKQLQAKEKITLLIEGEEVWSTAKNLLANHLQKQGYKVGENYNAILQVSGNEEKALLFDGKIKQSKISLLVSFQEPNGTSLFSKEFSLKATSLQSENDARRKALLSLSSQIGENIFQDLVLSP